MLNLTAPVQAHLTPYSWAVVEDLITPDNRARLRKDIPPLEVFKREQRLDGGDKIYGMYVLPLVDKGVRLPVLDRLGPAWVDFVAAVDTDDYRSWVESTVGATIRPEAFDVGLFVFAPGDWVSSHTDKSEKSATHVLYLNESWAPDHGGAFEVREGVDLSTPPYESILPAGGRSVLFAQSERSWHAVAPVTSSAPDPRFTIQVEMWR
ncbi:hypothetical protein GCM10012275_19640 [Longimycelium tulufanense]|uniref:Fe2OG dioxygenase domain-containing protein n=1 Tax=Longimycelium tulufanense TaxID=907463 RepID=A0A8J3FTE0_9PSEU|nr:2OG-Fe(II) oxygenase [Longimycelium tulufanense]GGM48778.1 hypothetical protein GCM10012275_19640 [Longimycelium tulufanense]